MMTLVAVLLAAFAVTVDTTIVNVALPALSQQLRATTSGLQWVVDAYNLAFAGLILAGGAMADRFGQRRALLMGLAVFALGSTACATAGSIGTLVAWRAVMGAAAAFVFPVTLSIILRTFPDRAERARAVGLWGAAGGAAVALGPVAGGALLEHFAWTSVFVVMVPLTAVSLAGAFLAIAVDEPQPPSRLDLRGLALSILGLTSLVYTVIDAPDHGWGSVRTLTGFAVAAAALTAFLVTEIRSRHPLLDVRLFSDMRFSAASGAVAIAWFALSGFAFLITLYLQTLRGYSPLEAGVRSLPVAVSVAVASTCGTALALRIGTRAVCAGGLLVVAVGYGWVAVSQAPATPYTVIAAQMLLIGAGIGLSTTPATEAILGVLRPDKAASGAAVNDATRLIGATLGVAVLGSVSASLYRRHLETAADVPGSARRAAAAGIGAVQSAAAPLPGPLGRALLLHADRGFLAGLHASCALAAAFSVLGALIVAVFLPDHPASAATPNLAATP